jgi:hypothetical protein
MFIFNNLLVIKLLKLIMGILNQYLINNKFCDVYLVNLRKISNTQISNLFNVYRTKTLLLDQGIVLSIGDGIAKVRGFYYIDI